MNDPQNPYPYGQSPTPDAAQHCPAEHPAAVKAPLPNHRQGRIARLPKAVRDKLNQMLLDGMAYKAIIVALGDDGKSLNEDVVSRWYQGGYQEWLQEEKDTEEMRVREEYALEFI